ncbi:acetyltransferase protein [Ketogulonicigenium vulgare Y25]|uniref:GNAT family N-acetyltransferase n=1 Tax=Ketogulonicigenium vulgare TaxID=92945 RepID=UPI0001E6709C|nr:GNAT family N-acetyltransferase [Ketogulonicigenium vulgare]ADO41890.1 acetyltransferase protein [Ketogulonicigenium vulgare Y25]ALJ80319.1 acetyltransferase [Ketogulonicigenium vulgare]AOZ53811.1 acetyltransferase protein [Ketogulonicigenium vulgare]
MKLSFTLTDAPDAAMRDRLGAALAAFNAGDAGPSEKRDLVIFVQDEAGVLRAGLNGFTAWGWLYTQWLWVDEAARGQGMARRLLDMAEAEARARGCHGAWIDTFSPHALHVYQRAGYAVFGVLPDFPPGRARSFLQKSL